MKFIDKSDHNASLFLPCICLYINQIPDKIACNHAKFVSLKLCFCFCMFVFAFNIIMYLKLHSFTLSCNIIQLVIHTVLYPFKYNIFYLLNTRMCIYALQTPYFCLNFLSIIPKAWKYVSASNIYSYRALFL